MRTNGHNLSRCTLCGKEVKVDHFFALVDNFFVKHHDCDDPTKEPKQVEHKPLPELKASKY